MDRVAGKPVASRNSGTSENSKAGSRQWSHTFHKSPAVVPHVGKVYRSYERFTAEVQRMTPQREHRSMAYVHARHTSSSSSSWSRIFEEFTIIKNQILKSLKQLFQVTEKVDRGSEGNQ